VEKMNAEPLNKSPLANISELELKSAETVLDWGKTLIVAPHPDDESLGCGGAIALLREFDVEVSVVVLSDGTLSHPHSKKFPAEKLRDLREFEIKDALEMLGVTEKSIEFFRYQDRSVPSENSENFNEAVERCCKQIATLKPDTILVPWRRDPHPDHRAAFQIINQATRKFFADIRIIEYPIWLWEIAESVDAPRASEVTAWRLDITEVLDKKLRAINKHKSQTTDLIDDDAEGFRLSPEVLENFATDWEVYLESI
jgi:LmbE family N-acetylglucosaminyl deacetylase